jgi:methionyl-tRNA formyltransferase
MPDATELRWVLVTEGRPPVDLALDEMVRAGARPSVVVTRPGQPAIEAAEGLGAEVVTVERLAGSARLFSDRGIELGVTLAWAELLNAEILSATRHGWLNAHPAELPAYRGGDPIGWQLVSRPARIGLTIHETSEHFDDGPIVAQERLPVSPDEHRRDVERRAFAALGRMVGEIVSAGPGWERRPQAGAPSYCPPVGTTALLNPAYISAERALGVIRALAYSPGVGVIGVPNLVHAAELGPALGTGERPGQVSTDAGTVRIACKGHWIIVTDASERSVLAPASTPEEQTDG